MTEQNKMSKSQVYIKSIKQNNTIVTQQNENKH